MPARRHALPAVLAAVLAAVLLLGAASPASASNGKQFILAISPAGVPAGTGGVAGSATFKNPADARQQLGSADLTPPAGFTVTEAKIEGRPDPVVVDRKLQLRNLSLAPGTSVTVTFVLRAPCQPPASSSWTVLAKQANDFNGTGNDIALWRDNRETSVTTRVDGSCSLRWVTRPEDAATGSIITGTRYESTGPAVRVEVADGRGTTIPTATGGVALRFDLQGGFGSLSGATSTLAGAGGAAFGSLRISALGTYSLVATVTSGPYLGLATVPSGSFRLDTFVQRCDPDVTCTQPVESGLTTLRVNALAANDRPYLTLSLDAGLALTRQRCGNWAGYSPGTALFNVTKDPLAATARAKRVSLTVDRDIMNLDPENGAPRLELCFGSPDPFYAKNLAGPTPPSGLTFDWDTDGRQDPVYIGLLPNCTGGAGPCVTQRKKVGAGDGYIEAALPSTIGDPAMRG